MKKIFLGLALVFPTLLFAQSFNKFDRPREYTQEGELISIRIVKSEPLRIFVTGKEEAKIDLSTLELTVRRLKPYPGQTLGTSLAGDHFIVTTPTEKDPTDLVITTKIKTKAAAEPKTKTETLKFNLK